MFTCEVSGCGKQFKTAQGRAGHMRWLHSERPAGPGATEGPREPDERTLEVIGGLAERVETLEKAGPHSVTMEQLGPALNEYLAKNGAHPGLCEDKACTPCRDARAAVATRAAQEGREQFAVELETSATWRGHRTLAEDLAQMHSSWIAAGKPPAESGTNGKSAGQRRVRVTRGS